MKTTLQRVRQFHQAFGIEDPKLPSVPTPNKEEAVQLAVLAGQMQLIAQTCHRLAEKSHCKSFLRLQLIQEELAELAEAFSTENPVDVLDALTDIQYVLDGTYLTCGMDDGLKEAAFDEVQKSNLSKLGEDGKPILNEAGRIQKGPNFFRPNLLKIYQEQYDDIIRAGSER